jgi:hypothetical protein
MTIRSNAGLKPNGGGQDAPAFQAPTWPYTAGTKVEWAAPLNTAPKADRRRAARPEDLFEQLPLPLPGGIAVVA